MSFLNKLDPKAIFKMLHFFGIDLEALAEKHMPQVVEYIRNLELQIGCKLMATVCLDTGDPAFIFSVYKIDATGAMHMLKEYRLTDLSQLIHDFKNGKFTPDADAGHVLAGLIESNPTDAAPGGTDTNDHTAGATAAIEQSGGSIAAAGNDNDPGSNSTGLS